MRYFNFEDLFTICLLLTAVAGRCSQLASATAAPTLLATALPAPTIPFLGGYFLVEMFFSSTPSLLISLPLKLVSTSVLKKPASQLARLASED
jgi:hypothetical protein